MADNYLERRMEDMKAGRLKPSVSAKLSATRKGFVEFPFPPRRVLVMGGTAGEPLRLVRAYLKTGSKVAVFDPDKASGEALAYKEGIRYYNSDIDDIQAVSESFSNLLDAWRDVDIVILSKWNEAAESIVNRWASHRDRYPVPFGYGGRLILLNFGIAPSDSDSTSNSSSTDSLLRQLHSKLSPHRIVVNAIAKICEKESSTVSDKDPSPEPRDLVRTCLLLSLPGSDSLFSLHIHL